MSQRLPGSAGAYWPRTTEAMQLATFQVDGGAMVCKDEEGKHKFKQM